MPYITKIDRKKYEKAIDDIVLQLNLSGLDGFYPVGDLNYIITTIIKKTLDRQGVRYQTAKAILDSELVAEYVDDLKSELVPDGDAIAEKRFNEGIISAGKLIHNLMERRRHRLPQDHEDYAGKE